ncbi:ABC transporter ATP-binding protein [Halobellus salinus]|uniref:ABC-type D-xylose/L-arabinose transporter n=1 Tax=Halobellus salinus TaxID=931585 RepID=A0A830ELU1_9EURY|nr:ABC transporter ATP-binding protein [Halobellus salinus]GGJ01624.1 ABC transporter ATP-binding protein [Halobellus salinus]SMP18361.1 multiple sugar transport system ATP-binding protein [Halobellus salinus]
MARVEIDNLTKRYGSIVATNDISLDIEDGNLTVLVGPSGCGKTTTLRSVAGLETPTEGSISFDGVDITDRPPQERDISMVFQDLALYPHMTGRENVAFPLRAEKGYSEAEIEEAVQEAAEVTDCDRFIDKKITDLSGGQQQRVALARALVRRPEVFLMDEPFSDLDELLKRQLRAEVVQLQQEFGVTMIHVTHDQEEAMTMGDDLVVMNQGDVVQFGNPDEVFSRPRTLFVAMFIGSPQINRFDCGLSWNGDTAVLNSGELVFELLGEVAEPLRRATETRLAVCIRPQRLSWAETEPEDGFSVPARVNVVEKIGTEDIVRCTTPEGQDVTAEVDSGALTEGMEGHLVFDPDNLHLFDGVNEEAERLN